MSNEERFLELIRSIDRQGADIEGLITYLKTSDFFYAPASTKYHCSYKTGLCEHELHTYDKLKALVSLQYGEDSPYSDTTLKIVALGHDISKSNFYEECVGSKKDYTPTGKYRDSNGCFNWEEEKYYKIKSAKDRYLFGTHGQNSERILSNYIPLSDEESIAIIWHMGGMDDNKCIDLPDIYNRYPLAVLLHMADYMATYLDESI